MTKMSFSETDFSVGVQNLEFYTVNLGKRASNCFLGEYFCAWVQSGIISNRFQFLSLREHVYMF